MRSPLSSAGFILVGVKDPKRLTFKGLQAMARG
jgi:hypothetical protein